MNTILQQIVELFVILAFSCGSTWLLFKVLNNAGLLDIIGVRVSTYSKRVEGGYGIFIAKIQPGTPASQVLQVEDQIVTVDGLAILGRFVDEAHEQARSMWGSEGSVVILRVRREGAEFECDLVKVRGCWYARPTRT